MAQEETSQLGVVEEIIASEELAVVKVAIFLTMSQCGGEHKSNTNRQKKKKKGKKVWTDVSTVKSNVTATTQELQDTLTSGLSL